MNFRRVTLSIALGILVGGTSARAESPVAAASGLTIQLDDQGNIMQCALGSDKPTIASIGSAELEGCSPVGEIVSKKLPGGGYEFVRRLEDAQKHSCLLTTRFTPAKDSIRWEMAVVGEGQPWTTPLVLRLKLPVAEKTRFWTSWVNGNNWNDLTDRPEQGELAPKIPDGNNWGDPLVPMPFMNKQWGYGNGKGSICLPLATILQPDADFGVSLIVSPDQPLLYLALSTNTDGTVLFKHTFLRLGEKREVVFSADLVAHEADWRGGLRWMVSRYPEYFNPPNPRADAMAGTASYTCNRGDFEAARFKKMAYRSNWSAAFDWPYYGMYLPPMPDRETCWESAGHDANGNRDPRRVAKVSYRIMNDTCRRWKENGLYLLNYFGCTEFGSEIKGPEAAKKDLPEGEAWRDANTFLYRNFPEAVFREANGDLQHSWSGSVAMDPGSPRFQDFLVAQVKRHVEELPDSAGICIDRMDWLPRVNYAADDHIGWYPGNRPGRLLFLSWNDTLRKIGALMHENGKVVFANCCLTGHRLDAVREIDGFYDEYGDLGYALNGSSLLAIRKPALMWTHDANSIKPDPDSYFQRHLHLGAYPTAPFPGNDHTILPDPKTDQFYFDYGPLLDAMRGKKWVLAPHCIESSTPGVKVNLFQVPDGYAAPVTFGGGAKSAFIRIRNIPGLDHARCEVLQPGVEAALPAPASFKDGVLELEAPLRRGCAMVKISLKQPTSK